MDEHTFDRIDKEISSEALFFITATQIKNKLSFLRIVLYTYMQQFKKKDGDERNDLVFQISRELDEIIKRLCDETEPPEGEDWSKY